MARPGHQTGSEGGSFDVGVVGEEVAGELGVFVGGEGVVDGDGDVVGGGDRDGDGGRRAGRRAVGGGVSE